MYCFYYFFIQFSSLLVTGSTFQNLSVEFAISATAIKDIVKEVLPLIWQVLKDEFVKFPGNEDEWKIVENGFINLGGLPHQLGALDGIFNLYI